jgi:galactose oxidase
MTMFSHRRVAGAIRLTVLLLPAILPIAPSSALAQPATKGEWSAVFDTQNVMIHAHVLPNGKVLFWSRREAGEDLDTMNNPGHIRHCTPRIWDPKSGTITATPRLNIHNLFCSGHTFLPDGRLFVAGGHISDSHGSTQTEIYDPNMNTWTRMEDTVGGRWYPTAVTLPDGNVLVSFGNRRDGGLNDTQQVWEGNHFRTNIVGQFNGPPLYPRMHVVPDGRVFMSGPLPLTQFLNTSGSGEWTFLNPQDLVKSSRKNGERQYACSVIYDVGKIVFIGGGQGDNGPPTNAVETLDLNSSPHVWQQPTPAMRFRRRQHNATLLPDGKVLVTGGTQGTGFNNLTPGQPIHAAELWDPKTGQWTVMAEEEVDRCYHSIAVLLPDATVLSAGGGEFRPNSMIDMENDPKDSHRDAQIFSPPYLFSANGTRAQRPDITSAPNGVTYGATFTVGTSNPGNVGQVNWVRLSSVTHSFNSNQRINFLNFTAGATSLSVTAPANANLCPPGHYMLFVLDKVGVPSEARMIQIR